MTLISQAVQIGVPSAQTKPSPSAPSPSEPQIQAAPALAPDQFAQRGAEAPESLGDVRQLAQSRAAALEKALAEMKSGKRLSQGFNALVNAFNGDRDQAEAAVKDALQLLKHDLPTALAELEQTQKKAAESPARARAAAEKLNTLLQRADSLSQRAEEALGLARSGQKFWSSTTAAIGSTLLVAGAAAVAARRFGVPLNLGTAAAGFVLGGAANVGAHALIDSQYQSNESLSTFMTGGLASAALVVSSRMPNSSLRQMVLAQTAVGGVTAGAGSLAHEAETGFQAGWQKRTAIGTATGAAAGALTGYAGAKLSTVLPVVSQPLLQKGMQIGTGAAMGAGGALAASLLTEGFDGFNKGWQQRVKQNTLGGAVTGAALSLAPQLESHPQPSADQAELLAEPQAKTKAPAKVVDSAEPQKLTTPEQTVVTDPAQPAQPIKPVEPVTDPLTDPLSNVSTPAKPNSAAEPKTLVFENEKLQAFEQKVMQHMMAYDIPEMSAAPVLLDQYGKPIGGPALGYGTVPPDMPVMPVPAVPSDGIIYPGEMPSPILRADGTPYHNSPQMGYGTAPPTLLDAYGVPVKGITEPVTIFKPDGTQATVVYPNYPGNGGPYGPPISGGPYGPIISDPYGTGTSSPYPTLPEPLPTLPNNPPDPLTSPTITPISDTPVMNPVVYPEPPMPYPDFPPPYYPPTGEIPTLPTNGTSTGYPSSYPSYPNGYPSNYPAPYPGDAYGTPNAPYPTVPGPNGTPQVVYPQGTILGADGLPLNLPVSTPEMPPGMGYGTGYGTISPLLGLDGEPLGMLKPPKPILNEFGAPIKRGFKETFYSKVFDNPELMTKDIKIFDDWTSTFSSNSTQTELRSAWVNMIKGQAPSTPLEKTVLEIYTTRPARWARLAEEIGIEVPANFKVFRGTHSEKFVEAVVKAWRDPHSESMQIPMHELSSWSLSEQAARGFAADANASVLFKADVPFERVLADKFVDDGTFFSKFSGENEVIVAISEKNSLSIPKTDAQVSYKGLAYGYADREHLISAWDQAHGVVTDPSTLPPGSKLPGKVSKSAPVKAVEPVAPNPKALYEAGEGNTVKPIPGYTPNPKAVKPVVPVKPNPKAK